MHSSSCVPVRGELFCARGDGSIELGCECVVVVYPGHQQWVNYFFHAGWLKIKGLKMSKSLKNFITIRQV